MLLGVWLSVCACPLALWQLGGLAGRWQAAIAAVLASLLLPVLSQSILLRGPQAPRRLQWDGQGGYSLDLAGGYRDGERSRFWQTDTPGAERPPIELWLAPLRAGAPPVPVYVAGKSILGWVTAYLASYSFE